MIHESYMVEKTGRYFLQRERPNESLGLSRLRLARDEKGYDAFPKLCTDQLVNDYNVNLMRTGGERVMSRRRAYLAARYQQLSSGVERQQHRQETLH